MTDILTVLEISKLLRAQAALRAPENDLGGLLVQLADTLDADTGGYEVGSRAQPMDWGFTRANAPTIKAVRYFEADACFRIQLEFLSIPADVDLTEMVGVSKPTDVNDFWFHEDEIETL